MWHIEALLWWGAVALLACGFAADVAKWMKTKYYQRRGAIKAKKYADWKKKRW